MLEAVRSWIMSLAACALFCALLGEVTPEGKVKSVQRAVSAIVMSAALFSPLARLDMEGYGISLAKYEQAAESITENAEKISDSLSRKYIEKECAAYILDKAQSFGCAVSGAEVEVKWSSEGVWYPVSASIGCEYDSRLAASVEANLGIAEENLKWSGNEDS